MRGMKRVAVQGLGLLMVGGCLWACVAEAAAQDKAANAAAAAAPSDAETVRGLRRLVDTGHAEEALKQIAQLRGEQPGKKGLSAVEGMALYGQGQLKGAADAFALAVAENAGDTESAEMEGLTLYRLGRPADAIPLLEGAAAKLRAAARTQGTSDAKQGMIAANRKVDPNYLLALCYMDTRRYDDARHAFAAQFGFVPDGAGAYLLTARMLFRREYLPVAQADAEKAAALEPGLPLAHALLGEIALAGNHMDEAIAEFEKERKANPLEPSVYDRLGDAYGRAGRYDEARDSLQQAVLLEPNSTGPYILLGKTTLKQGDPVGAARYLERAAKMDPSNYMTHSLLGQAYRAMGRTEDASREAAMAQKLQAASEPKLETVH